MKFGGIVDSGRGQLLAISKFPKNPRWSTAPGGPFLPMLIDLYIGKFTDAGFSDTVQRNTTKFGQYVHLYGE